MQEMISFYRLFAPWVAQLKLHEHCAEYYILSAHTLHVKGFQWCGIYMGSRGHRGMHKRDMCWWWCLVAVLYSEPIFLDRVPYRSLGQNLVSVPIPNQFHPSDLEPIPYRSRSLTSSYRTSLAPLKKCRTKQYHPFLFTAQVKKGFPQPSSF